MEAAHDLIINIGWTSLHEVNDSFSLLIYEFDSFSMNVVILFWNTFEAIC